MYKVEKSGVSYELSNEIQLKAFLKQGYTLVESAEPSVKRKPAKGTKASVESDAFADGETTVDKEGQ